MVVVAWVIERLALRHLVNQEPITLLMATLGIAYLLDGLGPMIFGSAVYSINVGMPKDPMFILDGLFEGGVLLSQEDLYAACIAALLVAALSVFFQKTKTGRALRRGRRPPGGPVHRHPAVAHLGHRLVGGRRRGPGGGHHLGLQAGRAVLAVAGGPEGPARGDPGRPDLAARRHHRRPDHRRGRKALRGLPGPLVGGGIETWFAYGLALCFLLVRPQGLFGDKIIDRV